MKRIVLLGPPGCGKGTQSNLLVKNNGFIQLSTGDLLREETSNKSSELGQKINKLMEIGELVPDEIVISMVVEKVKKHQDKSIIFDGFPRNLNQARVLNNSLEEKSLKLDHAILIEVDFKILEERILKRAKESNNEKRLDDNLETLNFISTSVAVITATKLYEGQPTLLCEASLLGVPSIFPER